MMDAHFNSIGSGHSEASPTPNPIPVPSSPNLTPPKCSSFPNLEFFESQFPKLSSTTSIKASKSTILASNTGKQGKKKNKKKSRPYSPPRIDGLASGSTVNDSSADCSCSPSCVDDISATLDIIDDDATLASVLDDVRLNKGKNIDPSSLQSNVLHDGNFLEHHSLTAKEMETSLSCGFLFPNGDLNVNSAALDTGSAAAMIQEILDMAPPDTGKLIEAVLC